MARSHGRILTSIWDDADFTALGEEQQRLYFFLLSQTNLNHAGLLPITLLRWARKAKGLTPALLQDRLTTLEELRFVVIDYETEELLIRTYIRNDGVWKQPNVMAAMVSAAQEIESVKLRRVLLGEMDRLPLDQLSDQPSARGGPSTREQIETHLANLRRMLRVPEPTPPGDRAIPSPEDPSENPSGRVSETPARPIGEPPTRAGAPAYTRASPAPAPTPTPSPTPTVVAVGAKGAGGNARPHDDDAHTIPPDFAPSDTSLAWAAQHGHTQRLAADRNLTATTAEFVLWHTGKGTLGVDWQALWRKWVIDQRQPPASANLPAAVGDNVVPFTQPGPASHNASVIAAFRARNQENR